MSEAVEPFLANSPIGPRLTVDETVRAVRENVSESSYLATQLRGFAQRRHVHVREKRGTGRTAANLYELDDVVAFKTLSILTEMGIANNNVLDVASLSFYTWKDYEEGRLNDLKEKGYQTRHPISAALSGFLKGEHWQFRMDFMRHVDTGDKLLSAFVYNPDIEEFASDPEALFVPRGAILIPLADICARVFARITSAKTETGN